MKTRIFLFNNTLLEDVDDIEEGLRESSYDIVENCTDLGRVNKGVLTGSVDMVIAVMNKRFDELFACVQQIQQYKPVPVVVFTYVDDREVIRSAIIAGVSAYIVDGLKATRIVPILDTARLRFEQQQAIQKELESTKGILSDRKLIEKAKGIVMRQLKIDEEEAYKSMRKMAMNKNMKIADLAQSVISTAELMM